jgi:hypothetical protein
MAKKPTNAKLVESNNLKLSDLTFTRKSGILARVKFQSDLNSLWDQFFSLTVR